MNQNGTRRSFQIALWGSKTNAQNERIDERGEDHAQAVAHDERRDDRDGGEDDDPSVAPPLPPVDA